MPRAPRAAAGVTLSPETRKLLEQCAAAAGTTADEHAASLVLRDAHARGLLPVEALPPTPVPRRSVIAPVGDDDLSRFAVSNAIGQC